MNGDHEQGKARSHFEPPRGEERPEEGKHDEGNGQGRDETLRDRARAARAEIGVSERGVILSDYAQAMTYANDMSQANELLQAELRGNRPIVAAIVRIAISRGLQPDLFATMVYVEKGRLCLMSAGFHVLALPFLDGGLKPEYGGEDGERRVTIRGKLKGDPNVYEYTSPPLVKLHPGHVTKDGRKFVKGSPEWDRKPDKQMFYDTRRDWIRMYCPQAIGGLPGVDELDDLPPMKDVTPPKPTLAERLESGDHAETGEGHPGEEHIRDELARIAPNEGPTAWVIVLKGTTVHGQKYAEDTRVELPERLAEEMLAQGTAVLPPKPKKARPAKDRRRPARAPSKAEVKRVADRAEKRSKEATKQRPSAPKQTHAEELDLVPETPEPAKQVTKATTPEQYVVEWRARVENALDAEALVDAWLKDRAHRDQLDVPTDVRVEIGKLIEQRADQLSNR